MKTIKLMAALSIMLASGLCVAADGAFEINQACVDTGCFPGDGPGFPVTLNAPGRYILTSNLVVPSNNLAGIVLSVSNIDLDLNGFMVSGPTSCSGSPLACSPVNSADGIDGTALTTGSIVRNGTVQGFNWGLATDLGWRVSNVVSQSNSNLGFFIRKGTIVRDCAARYNGNVGFQVGALGRLTTSTASNNVNSGVSTFDSDTSGGVGGATLSQNTIYDNGVGIADYGRATIVENMVSGNSTYGIRVDNGGSLVFDNHIMNNGGNGLFIGNGSAFAPSGLPVGLKGNFISNNAGVVSGNQIGGPGVMFGLGGNICGTAASCP